MTKKQAKNLLISNKPKLNLKQLKANVHAVAYTSGLLITAFTGVGLVWLMAKKRK